MKPKKATKDTKRKSKRNRRNQSKYPALEKKFTLKGRQEFIDTEYINGVFDKDGNQVIRGLTDEEKEWLNKFYQEDLNASFNHDDPLIDTTEGRKKSYDANNARNRDIYNRKRSMGMLKEINDESYNYAHQNMINHHNELEEHLNDSIQNEWDKEREKEAQEEWENNQQENE
jgi:hypothetical protein